MADIDQQAASNEPEKKKARLWLRLLAWVVGAIAALVFLALGALFFVVFVRPDLLAPALARAIEPLGYEAQYQDLRVSVNPPALHVENLTLSSKNMPDATGRMPQEFAVQAVIPVAELVLDLERGWESGVWVDSLRVENPIITVYAPVTAGDTEPGGMAVPFPAVFRELHVTGGSVTAHLPRGVVRVRDVSAHIDEGAVALERTFTASVHAEYEPAVNAMSLTLDASVTGGISPLGEINVAATINEGRLDGPQETSFQGAAHVRVMGEVLTFEGVEFDLQGIRATIPGGVTAQASSINLAVKSATLQGAETLTLKGADVKAHALAVIVQDAQAINLERISLIFPDSVISLSDRKVTASGFSVSAPQLMQLTGNLGAEPDNIALDAQGTIDPLKDVQAKAGPFLPQAMRDISVAGRLPFTVSLAGRPDTLNIVAEVTPKDVRVRLAKPALNTRVNGKIAVSGPLNESLELSGDIATRGDLSLGDMAVKDARVSAVLGGTTQAPVLEDLEVRLAADGLKYAGESPPLGELILNAQSASLSENRLEARGLKVTTERLGEFNGRLSMNIDKPEGLKAEVSAQGLDVAGMYAVAQDAGIKSVDLADLAGVLDLQARIGPSEAGRLVQASATFSALSFTADQGSILAGELAGSLTANFGLSEPRSVQAKIALTSGEALLDTYYLDFGSYHTELAASTIMHGSSDFRDASAGFAMEGIGKLLLSDARYTAEPGGHAFAGRLEIKDLNLPTTLQVFVKEPLSFARPDLAELTVEGAAGFVCDFAGQGEVIDVSGLFTLDGLDCAYPAQGVAAEGLSLRLPFAYRLGARAKAPVPAMVPDWGRMSWDSLTLPTGTLSAGSLDLALVKNALFTRGRLPLPLPGGEASLGPVRVDEPFSLEHIRLVTSAVLERLDLSALPTEVVPLSGMLAGELPEITATSQSLKAKGGVKGEFFGGELTASGFSVIRPFSEGRVLGVDALVITGIELEPLSQALDIGRITGILDIDVTNYRQAFGQPVALELTARSRKVRSVSQRVSLKAVNAISVMGTGSGLGDVGVGMFAGFFEEFGYDAIGISSSLNNDVFRVRGLIRQGGVEYLIKKPLLFGINVINRNPDNQISFSDMMERVQRVVGGGDKEETDSPKEES